MDEDVQEFFGSESKRMLKSVTDLFSFGDFEEQFEDNEGEEGDGS